MRDWEEAYQLLRQHDKWEDLKPYLEDYGIDAAHSPSVEDVWGIMDQVWDDMGLDNTDYDESDLDRYYSHPVWFFNGLFVETDPQSLRHRNSLADFFRDKSDLKIMDYGGGFGTLAKKIAERTPSSEVFLYEPHASEYARRNVEGYENIEIVGSYRTNYYDALVNTDVVEHAEDPIEMVSTFNAALKIDGWLISHWNFTPCIKCHLPRNFHFRFTFADSIVPALGFSREIKNKHHGHLFRKKKNTERKDKRRAYIKARISRLLYPVNRTLRRVKGGVAKVLGASN